MNIYKCWDHTMGNLSKIEIIRANSSFEARKKFADTHNLVISDIVAQRDRFTKDDTCVLCDTGEEHEH